MGFSLDKFLNGNTGAVNGYLAGNIPGYIVGSQSDQARARSKSAASDERARQADLAIQNTHDLNNYGDGSSKGSFSLYGTPDEVSGQLAGLNQAQAYTGKNALELGQSYQRDVKGYEDMYNGKDPNSIAFKNTGNARKEQIRSAFAQQGVKGGAAVNAQAAVDRQAENDVGLYNYNSKMAALDKLTELDKNSINFTRNLQYTAGNQGNINGLQAPVTGNNYFGTYLCTHFYLKGDLPQWVYEKDALVGMTIKYSNPDAYYGYALWAEPLAKKLKTSPILEKIARPFVLSWAYHMAGERSLLGWSMKKLGLPVCSLINKTFGHKTEVKYGNC